MVSGERAVVTFIQLPCVLVPWVFFLKIWEIASWKEETHAQRLVRPVQPRGYKVQWVVINPEASLKVPFSVYNSLCNCHLFRFVLYSFLTLFTVLYTRIPSSSCYLYRIEREKEKSEDLAVKVLLPSSNSSPVYIKHTETHFGIKLVPRATFFRQLKKKSGQIHIGHNKFHIFLFYFTYI